MPNNMTNNASNVTAGKPKVTGAIFSAPITATVPTNASSALSSDFTCLGYVSEDGVENSNDMDVSSVKAWGGVIVLRTLNEQSDDFKLTLIEAENVDVLKTVYGDSNVSVDGSGNIAVTVKPEDPVEKIWVIELALRNGEAKRIVIPKGAITAREAITYNDSDPVGYGITISAYPNSSGETHKEYITAPSSTVTTFTVTFNVDSGSEVPSQTVVSGNMATRPVNPTKDGYTFAGWYSNAGKTTEYDFYAPVTANTTIYAKWTS